MFPTQKGSRVAQVMPSKHKALSSRAITTKKQKQNKKKKKEVRAWLNW
jgi:hypothetical protein